MIIRDASTDDAAAIAAIANHYIQETSVSFNEVNKSVPDIKDEVAARHAAGCAYLVAERDQKILGFATYSQFRSGTGYRHTMEHTVMISPNEVGQGTGGALMQALETHARAAGVHSLVAGISAENSEAIGFHRKIGFDHIVCLPEMGFKFGRWIDLVLLQKRLLSDPDSR